MSAPLVSCVVPVFNGERYLAEALESVLGQTYRALEVIVVDDGSTDGTPAVVGTFGARVRCVTQPNAGLAAARNRGLAAATAELIAFLDADDLWLPEKIACQVERFRARPELEVSVTHIQNFWSADEPDGADAGETQSMEPMPGYASPTMLARRSVFARVGPYDAALRTAACRDWFIRAREQNVVFDLLSQVLVRRRLHRTNMSRQPGKVDDYARLVKRHLDRRRGRAEAR
jgi:glycosyltransferase involved in cell wall biosynthesis